MKDNAHKSQTNIGGISVVRNRGVAHDYRRMDIGNIMTKNNHYLDDETKDHFRRIAVGDIEGETFGKADAVDRLDWETERGYNPYPIRRKSSKSDEWLIHAESDSYNGNRFVSKSVWIKDGHNECETCGNTRREHSTWNNGIVGGYTEKCTICEHIYESHHG